jgi:hypothetical protein
VHGPLSEILRKILSLFRKHGPLPEDPYAYVTAPKRPRLPGRSAAVAEEAEN